MLKLLSLAVELWTDGKNHGIALELVRFPEMSTSGLQRVSFYFAESPRMAEFSDLVSGKRTSCTDIRHHIHKCGEHWLFYDYDLPYEDVGVMNVPFMRVHFPRTFMRAILRVARWVWRQQAAALASGVEAYHVPRVRLELSRAHLERAARLFGQGRGRVAIKPSDAQTADFLERCKAEAGPSFLRQYESLERIARNSTFGHHQTATLAIARDGREWWEGFYWQAFTPRGERIMNGGLINHGHREGRPDHDWSVHT